jgi:Lipase
MILASVSTIGLDPARPLIEQHADRHFRLTRDDARVVQVIHTNAGFLGQQSMSGTVDFCINGGAEQPYCKSGNPVSKFVQLMINLWMELINILFPFRKSSM